MAKNRQYIKYLLQLVIMISLCVLIFTSYKQLNRIKAAKKIESILNEVEKPNAELNSPSITINNDDKVYSTSPNLQKEWLDINNDYQGWLYIEGTNIDYPVVRALDNSYYLDRDFLKEKSELGAIFMDYRNIGNFNDTHTAIYGHFTWNGKMFADLHNYKDKNYILNNNIIKFNTLYGEKEFQIFSVYVDSATDYKLQFDFFDDLEYENYLINLKELSMYELPFELNTDKLLITLATCSYEIGNGRLIIHGIEK